MDCFSCFVAYCLKKVGFPQTDSAVNKKRVVKIADVFETARAAE